MNWKEYLLLLGRKLPTALAAILGTISATVPQEQWMVIAELITTALLIAISERLSVRNVRKLKKAATTTIPLLLCVIALTGCARFSTKQTDLSYETNGTPKRTITTRATAYTLFSAKSQLTNWKATQTDKSQGATVGALAQEADATNYVNLIEATARGVAAGLNPAKAP